MDDWKRTREMMEEFEMVMEAMKSGKEKDNA
jgi:hypothetical protein